MANKTNSELLQELIDLMTPMAEMAKYQIQQINNDIERNKIVQDFLQKQQEESQNNDLDADLEVVEAEEV